LVYYYATLHTRDLGDVLTMTNIEAKISILYKKKA